MKLIDDWRQWPRFYSTWAFSSIATIQGATAFLSAEVLAARVPFMPAETTWATLIASATAFLAITGAIGRLIDQSPSVEKVP